MAMANAITMVISQLGGRPPVGSGPTEFPERARRCVARLVCGGPLVAVLIIYLLPK